MVVLAKEVPDLEAMVKVTADGGALEVEKRRGLNFFDEIAVEAALKLEQSAGASVLAVSAGAGTGIEALRRALAMGSDAALLVDDPALEHADSLTVARALAAAARREGFDLVLAGKQATDDEAGLVGPMVAELLGVPCVTNIIGLQVEGDIARVTRETEAGRETLSVALPAVLTVEKGLAEPRVPAVMGVMKAMKAQIPRVTLAELGAEAQPPLTLAGYATAPARPPAKMLEGEPATVAVELARLLKEEAKVL